MQSLFADLLQFIDQSPTPFHAVANIKTKLQQHHYLAADSHFSWQQFARQNQETLKIFSIKHDSTIFIAHVPAEILPETRILLLGAHTDSPNLRLKANGFFKKEKSNLLNVEPYGGVLLATWLDRDLSVAGRITTSSPEGAVESELFYYKQPFCRIPNLAIHLNREVNEKGLLLDKNSQLAPLFAIDQEAVDKADFDNWLSRQMNLQPHEILGYDLSLTDTQQAVIGGQNNEFIFAPRLDNLAMCHSLNQVMLQTNNKRDIVIAALFDHEEVGSESNAGAASNSLASFIQQIFYLRKVEENIRFQIMQQSLFISADMAHAVHPNFAEKHDPHHKIYINHGPVLKYNNNQRYTTNAKDAAALIQVAREYKIPLQKFSANASIGCGSTIGPIIAARLGFAAIDIGNPMLSMHSIREMAGVTDHQQITDLLTKFIDKE